MSEYSTEKVLEWVNSSEAKAAKYEQEAKVGRIVFDKSDLVANIYNVWVSKSIFHKIALYNYQIYKYQAHHQDISDLRVVKWL